LVAEPEKLAGVSQRKSSLDQRAGSGVKSGLGVLLCPAGSATCRHKGCNHPTDVVGKPNIEIQSCA
jgi:hypothetical protein